METNDFFVSASLALGSIASLAFGNFAGSTSSFVAGPTSGSLNNSAPGFFIVCAFGAVVGRVTFIVVNP